MKGLSMRQTIVALAASCLAVAPLGLRAQTVGDMVGAWSTADPTGFERAKLNVTCNDAWDATLNGKVVRKARGQYRIFVEDGRLYMAEQPFKPQPAVEATPLTVTPMDGGAFVLTWEGSREDVTFVTAPNSETTMNMKSGHWSLYLIRCPVLPGETPDGAWAPLEVSVASFVSCQILNMAMAPRAAARGEELLSKQLDYRAQEWGLALAKLKADPDAEIPVAERWKAALADEAVLETLIAAEDKRCGDAPPSFPFSD
jgi:hypothetical protein